MIFWIKMLRPKHLIHVNNQSCVWGYGMQDWGITLNKEIQEKPDKPG